MSQLEQIVRNIALESKKCNYNPEIGTNWDCLPMEMRLECVKRMDFRTRTRLSATSKTEKSLVEAKKYNIDQVRFYCDRYSGEWIFEMNSETFGCFQPNAVDSFVPAMFKNCEIKNFWVKGVKHLVWTRQQTSQALAQFAPLQFERVSIFRNDDFLFFMKNCVNLEKVDYSNDCFGYDDKLLLKLPSMLKVKEFRLLHTKNENFMEFLNGLVQKWIENDVKVGKSVQFVVTTRDILNIFASKFADRIIEKTNKIVRIRMNNEKSQVLLRKVGSRLAWSVMFGRHREFPFHHCSCKVIPIDMPESEYATGDGWIQAIYEKGLKRDGKLKKAMEFDAEDRGVWDSIVDNLYL